MRMLKFGGTSVANAARFLRVADILESNAQPVSYTHLDVYKRQGIIYR